MIEKTNLMSGKRGLVMGVANDHSIAWGIAKVLRNHGAELAFTFQDQTFEKRVRPLAEQAGSVLVIPCDVEDKESQKNVFEILYHEWGTLDFVVHSLAYSDKHELSGRYLDTSVNNFVRTMHISCFSFTEMANLAQSLMVDNGGSLITLTYYGAERIMPNYNIMGVAKAALQTSVKYLAADLGPNNIRVNALSAGPVRTLAGSAIGSARKIYKWSEANAPLRRSVTLDQLGMASLYLLSDMSEGVTGEIHHVDAGYNIIGLPHLSENKK